MSINQKRKDARNPVQVPPPQDAPVENITQPVRDKLLEKYREVRRAVPAPPAPPLLNRPGRPAPALEPIYLPLAPGVAGPVMQRPQNLIQINHETEFSKSLGPTRTNPASPQITSFWIFYLNEMLARDEKIREYNLISICIGRENVYQNSYSIDIFRRNLPDINIEVFKDFPEYYKIQLNPKGEVIIPSFNPTKVTELAKKISLLDIDRTHDDTYYFNRLKNLFFTRKEIIIRAKIFLDGAEKVPEKSIVELNPNPLQINANRYLDFYLPRILENETTKQYGLNTLLNYRINLIKSMMSYPENSNLENYLMLPSLSQDTDAIPPIPHDPAINYDYDDFETLYPVIPPVARFVAYNKAIDLGLHIETIQKVAGFFHFYAEESQMLTHRQSTIYDKFQVGLHYALYGVNCIIDIARARKSRIIAGYNNLNHDIVTELDNVVA